jgi:hypothetical protein
MDGRIDSKEMGDNHVLPSNIIIHIYAWSKYQIVVLTKKNFTRFPFVLLVLS